MASLTNMAHRLSQLKSTETHREMCLNSKNMAHVQNVSLSYVNTQVKIASVNFNHRVCISAMSVEVHM